MSRLYCAVKAWRVYCKYFTEEIPCFAFGLDGGYLQFTYFKPSCKPRRGSFIIGIYALAVYGEYSYVFSIQNNINVPQPGVSSPIINRLTAVSFVETAPN